nr:MAG TPA: urease beta subunit [Caudoviricetes sp.]
MIEISENLVRLKKGEYNEVTLVDIGGQLTKIEGDD